MPQNRKFQDFVGNDYTASALPKHLVFLYDFTVGGGSQGAIALTDLNGNALTIPDNAIITNAHVEVTSPVASGGSATLALGVTGNTDAFKAATAYTTFTPTYVAQTANDLAIKLDGAKSVLLTIATADLLSGSLKLYVEYIEGTA